MRCNHDDLAEQLLLLGELALCQLRLLLELLVDLAVAVLTALLRLDGHFPLPVAHLPRAVGSLYISPRVGVWLGGAQLEGSVWGSGSHLLLAQLLEPFGVEELKVGHLPRGRESGVGTR